MRRHTLSALALTASFTAFFTADAFAGQFKRLEAVAALPVGGALFTLNSPQNFGGTMEMDVFEWPTAPAGGGYSCSVTFNNTGQAINIRLIGVNGTIITSCTTAVNGTCATPVVNLAGNTLFDCLIATQFAAPAGTNTFYQFAVSHPSGFGPVGPADRSSVKPSGVAGSGATSEN
jgi:hypothetical protein